MHTWECVGASYARSTSLRCQLQAAFRQSSKMADAFKTTGVRVQYFFRTPEWAQLLYANSHRLQRVRHYTPLGYYAEYYCKGETDVLGN